MYGSWLDRLHFSWRRVPQIIQTEAAECGLASLAMVFAITANTLIYRVCASATVFRHAVRPLRTLMDIAAANEMKSRALKLDIDELNALENALYFTLGSQPFCGTGRR